MSEEEREKFKQGMRGMRGWRERWSRGDRNNVADAKDPTSGGV